MNLREWVRPPRHLLALFFGITLVSAAALGWLGWQLIEQDRALASKRAGERRENAAGLAVTALQKRFSDVEERLSALMDLRQEGESLRRAAEYGDDLPADAVLLILDGDGVDAQPSGRLLYYPALPLPPDAPDSHFAEAEARERERDYAAAVELLREAAGSADPVIRLGALVRLGRNLRRIGPPRAVDAIYTQVSQLGDTTFRGVPAELLARRVQASLHAERGEHEKLVRVATALTVDLSQGKWRLPRAVYDASLAQVQQWLGPDSDALAAEPTQGIAAITEVAELLWDQWHSGRPVSQRQTLWAANRSVLVVSRGSGNRLAAFVAGPAYVQSAWLAELDPLALSHGAQIGLTDREGLHVTGPAVGSGTLQHSVYSTGLPWTVSAVAVNGAAGTGELTTRSRIVMASLVGITILVLGGSYLIGRAVARELAVARLQSDFVAAVSHEFRTPLTAMRQLSELLAKGRVPNEEIRQKYYDVLEQESSRLHRLVEGLLKFGRMQAGAMRYQFEKVDSAALVSSLVEEFSREAERRGCRIELNANHVTATVSADREALGCAVWNLLDNAVKYSPGQPTVWVDLARENGAVAIRVRDQGVGIAPEHHHRIFEKFVRGDVSQTLGVQGAGIGLAVAQQIVARHGGHIQVESAPGRGSTFTVRLPLAATGELSEEPDPKRMSASSAASRRILKDV